MPDVSPYKPWIKIILQSLALLMVVIIIARPRMGVRQSTDKVSGIEVMIAMDVSNSMLASSDDNPSSVSRLQKSKMLLEKLMGTLENDKVGLIVFAGNAYTQIPLTTDFGAAKMFLNSITPDMIPTQGTAIGEAIRLAMNSFSANEKSQKAIILLTDGENFEDDAERTAKEAAKRGFQVDVIGIGGAAGASIPLANGQMMRDEQGNMVVTRLNVEEAEKIAKAGKGIYVSGNNGNAVKILREQLDTLAKTDLNKTIYKQHDEQFPIFAWIALIILVCDIFVLDRKISWLKNINFFTKDEK